MSLFESGESNGSVSLIELFDNPEKFEGCKSDLDIDGIIYAICRGGWPNVFRIKSEKARLNVAKALFVQTVEKDISNVDKVKRNPIWAETILKSYARNICTLADTKTIFADAQATTGMSKSTFFDYVPGTKQYNKRLQIERICCIMFSDKAEMLLGWPKGLWSTDGRGFTPPFL